MAAKTKEILCESVQGQEILSLSRGRKPTHVTFPLPSRFVGDFGSIVRIDVIEMFHGRHHRAVSGIIASQFIGYQPAGFPALAFE